jgi:hypothetical protein
MLLKEKRASDVKSALARNYSARIKANAFRLLNLSTATPVGGSGRTRQTNFLTGLQLDIGCDAIESGQISSRQLVHAGNLADGVAFTRPNFR